MPRLSHITSLWRRRADPPHAELLRAGVETLAAWQRAHPGDILELAHADLAGLDLAGADLRDADLCEADLSEVILDDADLTGATLRHASLRGVDLTRVRGLGALQLAGTDLTGAKLPASISVEDLCKRAELEGSAPFAHHIFLWMLGICAFCWLIITTTSEVQLVANDGRVELPFFDLEVPTMVFFLIGPAMLLGVYHYFHIYMQRQWETLATLPAVFPDGEPLDRKAHGWMMFGIIRSYLPRLSDRPALYFTQRQLNLLFGWHLVPATILAAWWRYSHRHSWFESTIHVATFTVAVYAMLISLDAAATTIRGGRRSRWRLAVGVVPVLMAGGMFHAMDMNYDGSCRNMLFNVIMFRQDVSQRPDNWGRTRRELSSVYTASLVTGELGKEPKDRAKEFRQTARDYYAAVRGAELRGVNLAGAWVSHSLMASSDLAQANLNSACLHHVDLSGATLEGVCLAGADLDNVWLIDSHMMWVDLSDAFLSTCYMLNADLKDANLDRLTTSGLIDLRLANFKHASLRDAGLERAMLIGASFKEAKLENCNLAKADLRYAKFHEADLRGTSFEGAMLVGADFTNAQLGESEVKSTLFQGRYLTSFCGTDLSEVRGLTPEQFAAAKTDGKTIPPKYFSRPAEYLPTAPGEASPAEQVTATDDIRGEINAATWPSSPWWPPETTVLEAELPQDTVVK